MRDKQRKIFNDQLDAVATTLATPPANSGLPEDIVEAAKKVRKYMHDNHMASLMGLSFRELTDLDF